MEGWSDYCETIATGLRKLAVTDRSGKAVSTADAVSQWVAMTRSTHDAGGQLYIIGNGGSAGMASHMAADACKNGHLRALSFSDVALLTATANDLAYEQVFSLPLERLARPGDLLIAISSSGNSPKFQVVRPEYSAALAGASDLPPFPALPGLPTSFCAPATAASCAAIDWKVCCARPPSSARNGARWRPMSS